jgi:hypothetical protein
MASLGKIGKGPTRLLVKQAKNAYKFVDLDEKSISIT